MEARKNVCGEAVREDRGGAEAQTGEPTVATKGRSSGGEINESKEMKLFFLYLERR
jgi:hypothetical protein